MSVSMYVQPEPHSCCGPVFWRDLRATQYVQLWLACVPTSIVLD